MSFNWQLFIVIIFLSNIFYFISAMKEGVDFYLQEVRSLSELPLNKLIQIKSTFADESSELENENLSTNRRLSSTLSLPTALPLRRSEKTPIKRHEEWHEKGDKDTKISKIFQLSITTLSFLAFGGYLLSLIIMAIRRTAAPTTPSFIVLSDVKNLQKFTRPKRNTFVFDPTENDFDTDKMYKGMVMLSRGYALYNQ